MTIVAQILFLLAAAGGLALASKYDFEQAPVGYQAEMLEKAGSIPDDMTRKVLAALYKVFVASLYGVAVAIAALAVFGVGQGGVWAKAGILAIAVVVAIPIFLSTYRMEWLTGVKTPWRSTLGLFGIAVAGFVLSMV